MSVWVAVLGGYGATAILGSFFLVTHGHLEPAGLYLLLNLTGAAGLALFAWKRRAWIPLLLNVLWGGVAGSALWRLFV